MRRSLLAFFSVTQPSEKVLIRVETIIPEKEVKVLDDNNIVELYLKHYEDAIRQTAESYGSRLRALA